MDDPIGERGGDARSTGMGLYAGLRRVGAILTIVGFAGAVGACAHTTFRPVTMNDATHAGKDDGKVVGIRYYRPATYVLIKPDYAKGKAEVMMFSGPDTSRLYAAEPWSWLATNTSHLTFDKGVLTHVISKSDSTKVAVDSIGAASAVVSKALEAAAASAKAAAARSTKGDPGSAIFLFKVEGTALTKVDLTW